MPTNFHPLPATGDILWSHFPQSVGTPGPKPRPVLVVAVSILDHVVEVIYGTSKKTTRIYPSEFVLDPSDIGFKISGLSYRTKFDFRQKVKLPFDSDWFSQAPNVVNSPLPKLGTLHSCYYKMASAASRK